MAQDRPEVRPCVFCGTTVIGPILVRIDYHRDKDGGGPKTYSEVSHSYSGIRAICVDCLGGLASLYTDKVRRMREELIFPGPTIEGCINFRRDDEADPIAVGPVP